MITKELMDFFQKTYQYASDLANIDTLNFTIEQT